MALVDRELGSFNETDLLHLPSSGQVEYANPLLLLQFESSRYEIAKPGLIGMVI
jgi:hypothetical protein